MNGYCEGLWGTGWWRGNNVSTKWHRVTYGSGRKLHLSLYICRILSSDKSHHKKTGPYLQVGCKLIPQRSMVATYHPPPHICYGYLMSLWLLLLFVFFFPSGSRCALWKWGLIQHCLWFVSRCGQFNVSVIGWQTNAFQGEIKWWHLSLNCCLESYPF